jgi:hypothetical protein
MWRRSRSAQRRTGVVVGRGQRIGRCGPPMRSPGRPEPSRAVERAFWRLIAGGLTTEDAAAEVGVPTPVASRWFRHAGGMSPISLAEPTGRYLSCAEREEIALLNVQDHGVREIARRIERDPATISRELRSARRQPNWPRTRGCGTTSSTSSPGKSLMPTDVRSPARTCPGPVGAKDADRTGVGVWPGARSRPATGSRSTSLMMSR